MSKTLDKPRYTCALGALQTVQAISRCLPILHAGPGCADKLSSGYGTSGYLAPRVFPCTNLSESEIVFGGEGKLREVIENSLKVVDADLYVVLTGCSSEIIGDDADQVTNEFRSLGKPVISVSTAGFKGSNYNGYEWVLEALIDSYLDEGQPRDVQKGLVNVFASLPLHDPYWAGNYQAIKGLLAKIGLRANIIFGYGNGIEQVKLLPRAEFTLVVNPWLGLGPAKLLEEKFSVPYLHLPALPVGPTETGRFLNSVAAFAGLDPLYVNSVISEEEKRYFHYIERFADLFLENRIMSKRFTVAAESQYSLAITKFLVNDMGLFPQKQFVMEDVSEKYRDRIEEEFHSLEYGISADVSFETDSYTVHEEIRKADYLGYPLIIGSSWDKKVAAELKAHYLPISWPLNERLVITSTYVGYDGALRFLEDLYSIVLTRFT